MNNKSKAGRKKGSYSFVIVPLERLNRTLGNDGFVVISKRYADSIGVVGQPVITKFHVSESVERPRVNQEAIERSRVNQEVIDVPPPSIDAPLVSVEDWN